MKRFIGKPSILVLSLTLIGSLLFNVFLLKNPHKVDSSKKIFEVIQVMDGDSVMVTGNFQIRLGGVEAPEKDNCYAEESKGFLEDLVLNKEVEIETFTEDAYNRPVGYLYLDGELVNQKLLEGGYARYRSRGAGPSKEDMLKVAHVAEAENRGLYGKCTSMTPKNKNCDIKGNINRDTKVRDYHLPECRHYNLTTVQEDRGEGWFCTEEEAIKAGYKKSTTC